MAVSHGAILVNSGSIQIVYREVRVKVFSILFFISALIGCASSYEASSITNWFKVGQSSAIQGDVILSSQNLSNEMKLDSIFPIDYQQYSDGYAKGLDEFCNVKNAFVFGAKGHRYHGQCEGRRNEPHFKYEWERGFEQAMFPKGPPG
ncbi:DUF2799 domain-containing protein [Photobacterium sagamiensis]|uniref:DUF2799 domain-containing protein n=1 Tax=Photobacterium sagamiensis TaxID=2910241 RepID=UPI003D0F46F5